MEAGLRSAKAPMKAAQALALVRKWDCVTSDDVEELVVKVHAYRLFLRSGGLRGRSMRKVILEF